MNILPDDCSIPLAANRFQDAFRLGIDVGSTTSKLALVGAHNTIVQSIYQRHQADVTDTLLKELRELAGTAGDREVYPVFTGSAGMGLAERTGIA
ncbi:MAG: hypothetical protein LJE64_09515, partial [Desulfofustis sp.]|nr:hypothetical protein [Desulfofustis sp.]